jgi:hypothetical protein
MMASSMRVILVRISTNRLLDSTDGWKRGWMDWLNFKTHLVLFEDLTERGKNQRGVKKQRVFVIGQRCIPKYKVA